MVLLRKPIIQVNQVTKDFQVGDQQLSILKGVTFDVPQGQFLAIVGPSGNGKSTLLNMITGIDRPTGGEIFVSGTPVHLLGEDQLAGWRGLHVGIVFQFFQLLPALSLLQNIILPMDFVKKMPARQRRERALELLEMVGLADQAYKLPSMVSGGQQQRAAIARALANDPPLIVADEPTGNLDVRTAADVFELFCKLNSQGKTLVMVTHNAELARQASRRIEIVSGEIVLDG